MLDKRNIIIFLKIASVFLLLYFFLSSIELMGRAFKLFGKGFAEQLISSCSNPFVGLFIGILTTSIVQSSSTTTSLVVGLAGSGILPVECCIPVVMGANIGTSITNTLVSLTFVTRKADFRRAFAAATVHDFFNIFSVLIFFPLEMEFKIIQKSAFFLTGVFEGSGGAKFTSPLNAAIGPFVHGVQDFLMNTMSLQCITAGVIMLVGAIVMLIISLTYLVRVMRSLIINKAESFISKYLFRNDAIAFLLGIGLTVAVQSSSVTTALIVPLVAAGIMTLEKCYPVTLGANLGTTCTAILASLATVKLVDGHVVNTMGITVAFAHLIFNILGTSVFYPLRVIPLTCARKLSELAERSKAWAFSYIVFVFFVIPVLMIYFTENR